VDLLRGRGRADAAPAQGPHLGTARPHPVVSISGNSSGRVSVAGLACLKAGEPGLPFYRMRLHRRRKGERRSMSEADYAELIAAAHRVLAAPVILSWDNLSTHRSAVMRAFTGAHPHWLTVIPLPAYAPSSTPSKGPGRT
jgi:hypothetical protein